MATTFDDLKRMTPAQAMRLWARVESLLPKPAPPPSRFEAFRNDPAGYAKEIGVTLWDKQAEILRSLLNPPHRTLVKSGHNLGKSFLAAVACCWWYDTRPKSVCITTAPTAESVRDIIWKEIRMLRLKAGLGGFHGTEQPLLKSGPDHYAKGRTAESGEAFQGRHDLEMLFIFDEAVGISRVFWETTNTMCKPGSGHAWLAIFNPTDTTSQAYQEEGLILDGQPKWQTIQMSALEHPNIAAQVAGQPPPYPSAVTLDQVWAAVHEGCQPVTDERRVTDFEFPPGSGQYFRPGPLYQSRWLGLWPETSEGVWSDALWRAAITPQKLPSWNESRDIQLGCDVARFGRDWTAFHVRWGNCSVHHSRVNGWSTMQTVGEIVRLATHYANEWNRLPKPPHGPRVDPQHISLLVDDDGVGGGVTDRLTELGYNVRPIRAGTGSDHPTMYPNLRSQLWFDIADLARQGMLDLSRLPREMVAILKQQAMAPSWTIDSAGRRVVEKKDDTRKKIGCSPDDLDSLNLAYHRGEESIGMPMILSTHGQQPLGLMRGWR